MKQWQVLLNFENVWSETFDSKEEAELELQEYIESCEEAVTLGYMEDFNYDDDYRVVRMK